MNMRNVKRSRIAAAALVALLALSIPFWPITVKAFEGDIPVPAPPPTPRPEPVPPPPDPLPILPKFMPRPLLLYGYDWHVDSMDFEFNFTDGESGDSFACVFRLRDATYSYSVDAKGTTGDVLEVVIDFDSNLSSLELWLVNRQNTTTGMWVDETLNDTSGNPYGHTYWLKTGWAMDRQMLNFTLANLVARGKLVLEIPMPEYPPPFPEDHDCLPGHNQSNVHATVYLTMPLWRAAQYALRG